MREWWRRFRYLLQRRRFEQELADEMECHREMAARDGGMPFGNMLRLREEAREAWGWTWLDHLWQDLRYAFRQLERSPGFTVAATLMLAIGIGVNVAAFGFFNAMVLRPLPVHNPDSLLRFKRRAPNQYASQVPYAEMAFFRQHAKTLSAVIGVTNGKLVLERENRPINGAFVTTNLFSELGSAPMLGRLLDPVADGAPDAEPVVVLSKGFWQRRFGGARSIAGTTIRLNGRPTVVIGVASGDFSGLSMESPDLWIPITQQPYFVAGSRLLTELSVDAQGVTMFGRLRPGFTASTVENELRSLAAVLHKQRPADIWEGESLPSSPGGYAKNLGGGRHGTGAEKSDEAYPLMALMGLLMLLILVVACGNLGSLLVARGIARETEITIRKALGASKTRLTRQLFTESVLLALLGSAAGLATGYGVLRGLLVLAKAPAWLRAAPDGRVLLFAIGMGLLSAVLFGLTPAWQLARQRQQANRLKRLLIGAQIAGSCILLVVAALLTRALHHAVAVSPGFEYQQVVSIDPELAAHGYTAARARTYLNTLQDRLRRIPGVASVSMTSAPPLGNKKVVLGTEMAGSSLDIHLYAIDPQFFDTMKIPLLQGRNLTRSDTHSLVISRSFASRWPEREVLGKPFHIGEAKYTVVGIAGSARLVALQDPEAMEAYYPAGETDLPSMVVLVRAIGPPEGLVPFVAAVAKSIDPRIFPEVQLVKSSFRRKMEGTEYAALSVSVLGCLALLLACLGVVGLVSYAISQRTKEIGLRMALGANPAHILSMVVRPLAGPLLTGSLIGVLGAASLSQILRRELYGVSHLDPVAYAGAVGLFAVMVSVAALVPARRALRVDPLQSLRYE